MKLLSYMVLRHSHQDQNQMGVRRMAPLIARFGRTWEFHIIAQGIEGDAQIDALCKLRCQFARG